MTLILNKPQAEAVFSAMCALNNVGARIHTRINVGEYRNIVLHCAERHDGVIEIYQGDTVGNLLGKFEQHADQNAFAAAYGLN